MRNLNRRTLITGTAGALLGMGSAAWAKYPEKPVKIIVPWAPGGSTDAIARALAQGLTESTRQTFLVDNKPGAAAQIGTDAAAKSAPDGYTLVIVELPHAIAPAVVAKLPYDLLRDFAPITLLGTSPMILFTGVGPESADLKTFVKTSLAAKAPPAMAHSGSGTVSHLAGEMFAERSKIKFNQVPYRGSAPALTDVAAGLVAGHFATLASGAALLSAGKIRAVAVAGKRRLDVPALRNIPTFLELGYKDFDIKQWWALVAPATTNVDTLEYLRSESIGAMSSPKVLERLSTLGIDLVGSTRDQLRGFMRSESERWQAVAKGIGLQPQ